MTKRRMLVGLIGANIQGSMSPALFADAFAATAIDGYYHLLDVDRLPERRLPRLLEAVKVAGFAGANVTYPFKQEIIPLLDAVDPEAAEVGAVNTVSIAPDGRTTGYNFDRRGWRNSFLEVLGGDSAKGKTVVQIGAGRAVAFALMGLGVAGLVIHDLDSGRANALKVQLSSQYGPSRCRTTSNLEHDIAAADGTINASWCARAQRQWNVCASGGCSISVPDWHRVRCGAAHARLSRLSSFDLGHQSHALGR